MSLLGAYDPDDLKRVYRALQLQIMESPELMDSQLFEDLQVHLQRLARLDEIDPRDHRQWEAWLRGMPLPSVERRRLVLIRSDG